MKEILTSLAGFLVAFVFILFLAFGGNILDSINYRIFGTINEQTRTQIFHESQAYTDGMIRDLYDQQRQYMKETNPEAKKAILAYARHQASVFPRNKVPDDLVNFYDNVMNNGG